MKKGKIYKKTVIKGLVFGAIIAIFLVIFAFAGDRFLTGKIELPEEYLIAHQKATAIIIDLALLTDGIVKDVQKIQDFETEEPEKILAFVEGVRVSNNEIADHVDFLVEELQELAPKLKLINSSRARNIVFEIISKQTFLAGEFLELNLVVGDFVDFLELNFTPDNFTEVKKKFLNEINDGITKINSLSEDLDLKVKELPFD